MENYINNLLNYYIILLMWHPSHQKEEKDVKNCLLWDYFIEIITFIERGRMHLHGIACTISSDMGWTSAKGQMLECFKVTAFYKYFHAIGYFFSHSYFFVTSGGLCYHSLGDKPRRLSYNSGSNFQWTNWQIVQFNTVLLSWRHSYLYRNQRH